MTVKVIFICVLTSLAIGCARVRIAGIGNDPVEREMQVNRYGWNLRGEDETETVVVNPGKRIGAVTVKMNYLQALATVMTFGMWFKFDMTLEECR